MKKLISVGIVLLMIACGSQVVQFPIDADADAGNGWRDGQADVQLDSALEADTQLDSSIDSPLDSQPDTNPLCTPVAGALVGLGTAGNFVMLAKSGVDTVPASVITGDVGVSPIAATGLTGFSLILDSSGTFSTSSQVTGKLYASDYSPPTPSNMTTAISDMETAFTDAAGRAPTATELGSGNIGSMTLAPGTYKWGTGLLIPTDVMLKGGCSDVWIFEVAETLTMNSNVKVVLSGGALASHVFWQVSGTVDLGTGAHLEGTVLGQTNIALHTGASVNGRLLAQTAVTLEQSTVTKQ